MEPVYTRCLVAAILLASSELTAGTFVNFGGSFVSFDDSFVHVDPINFSLRGGYAFNDRLEVGMEFSNTIDSDSIGKVDFDVTNKFLFIQVNFPLDGGSSFYLLLGPTEVSLESSGGTADTRLEDSGVGYGFGVKSSITANVSYFAIDYINYFDDDKFEGVPAGVTVEGINFNYVRYF